MRYKKVYFFNQNNISMVLTRKTLKQAPRKEIMIEMIKQLKKNFIIMNLPTNMVGGGI